MNPQPYSVQFYIRTYEGTKQDTPVPLRLKVWLSATKRYLYLSLPIKVTKEQWSEFSTTGKPTSSADPDIAAWVKAYCVASDVTLNAAIRQGKEHVLTSADFATLVRYRAIQVFAALQGKSAPMDLATFRSPLSTPICDKCVFRSTTCRAPWPYDGVINKTSVYSHTDITLPHTSPTTPDVAADFALIFNRCPNRTERVVKPFTGHLQDKDYSFLAAVPQPTKMIIGGYNNAAMTPNQKRIAEFVEVSTAIVETCADMCERRGVARPSAALCDAVVSDVISIRANNITTGENNSPFVFRSPNDTEICRDCRFKGSLCRVEGLGEYLTYVHADKAKYSNFCEFRCVGDYYQPTAGATPKPIPQEVQQALDAIDPQHTPVVTVNENAPEATEGSAPVLDLEVTQKGGNDE